MYLNYFGDKESDMYPGSVNSINNSLPTQAYPDHGGYLVPHMEEHSHSSGGWDPNYGLPREGWGSYGPGMPSLVSAPMHGHIPHGSHEYSPMYPASTDLLPLVDTGNTLPISSSTPRPHPFVWMRKTTQSAASGEENELRRHKFIDFITQNYITLKKPWDSLYCTAQCPQPDNEGKTRTKEKYRVVYTDHQRLELEKEFLSNRYITIRRKSELAASLGLSDRQVKIWFQNRRAKERKMMKKIGQFEGSGGSVQSDSGSVSPTEMSKVLLASPHVIDSLPPTDNMQQVTVSQ